MRKLVITTFLSLDGVMQGPGGPEEDRSGGFDQGGWLVPYADADMGRIVNTWIGQASGFLLGRGTYEIFSAYWPRVTDPSDVVAKQLNQLPKYVASRTLKKGDWAGTTILQGDVVEAVGTLKREGSGEIQVHGSAGLAQTLIENDLIDEFRLWVYPVVIGSGKRLFGSGAMPAALKLRDTQTTSTGVVVHTYERAGAPRYGHFSVDENTSSHHLFEQQTKGGNQK